MAGPWLGLFMAVSAGMLVADAVHFLFLAVDSVTVGAFSLPQVDLALFELFAQGVTWSSESQLFWAAEGCLDFICLRLLS